MHGDVGNQDRGFPKLGSPEDLEQRLRLIPIGDMGRGFVFTSVLGTVRREAGTEAWQRCVAPLEQETFLPFFNYPFRRLLRLFYAAAGELSGKFGGFERAIYRIGAGTVPDFHQSTLGRTLLSMTGMDARRLLDSFPFVYPNIYAHGTMTVTWTGPTSGESQMSGNLFPTPFLEAAITYMLEPLRLPGVRVRARRVGLMQNEVHFSWE